MSNESNTSTYVLTKLIGKYRFNKIHNSYINTCMNIIILAYMYSYNGTTHIIFLDKHTVTVVRSIFKHTSPVCLY